MLLQRICAFVRS